MLHVEGKFVFHNSFSLGPLLYSLSFQLVQKMITGQYDTREGVSSAIYIHVVYAHMLKFLRYKWYRSHVSLQNRDHLSYDKVCMARGTDPDEDAMCGV